MGISRVSRGRASRPVIALLPIRQRMARAARLTAIAIRDRLRTWAMSETAMKRQAIPKGKKSVGRNFDKKKAIDPQLSGEAEHIARIANLERRMLELPLLQLPQTGKPMLKGRDSSTAAPSPFS